MSLSRQYRSRGSFASKGVSIFLATSPRRACLCREATLKSDAHAVRHVHQTNLNEGRRRVSEHNGFPSETVSKKSKQEKTTEPRVAILGGGVTGLTAAFYLAESMPKAKITLYEASDRVGGWIQTDKKEVEVGGVKKTISFERGPRSVSPGEAIHGQADRFVLYDLAQKTGLPCIPAPSHELPRYIYHGGKLVQLPPHNSIWNFVQEPLFWAALPGIARWMYKAYTRRDGTFPEHDMSIGEWIRRASGSRELADIMSAGIHGIWGGNIDQLSAMSVLGETYQKMGLSKTKADAVSFRYMEVCWRLQFLREHPDVVELMNVKPQLMTFGEHGMQALPAALHDMLQSADNVDIRLSSPVSSMTYQEEQDAVEIRDGKGATSTYDKVISTLPAQHLARLAPSDALSDLADFRSVSIMTVNIWYPTENLVPPGVGYLIPRSCPPEENPERALGVFFDSELLTEQRAKEGGTKLYVLLGGHHYEEGADGAVHIPSETEAIEQAKALLERHLGIPRDTPCFAMASLKPECLPQHLVYHHTRMGLVNLQIQENFKNTLAVGGGSFSRPGVMGALRAGYDLATGTRECIEREAIQYPDEVGFTGVQHLFIRFVENFFSPLEGKDAFVTYMQNCASIARESAPVQKPSLIQKPSRARERR